ncbi:MAG: GTP-binding protein, partial [Acidobacteria bacterium]|nr:GTP-binding protein [Acidobacteriota bacterium]
DNTSLADRIRQLAEALEALDRTFGFGRILAAGLHLAIVGKPNVGKSSLFNHLVAADRALVTEIPGTTRDVLRETVSLDGVPLCFADTAGLRQTSDRVESLGVMRTEETLSDADMALVVLDGSSALDADDRRVLSKAKEIPHLVVINKHDLPQALDPGSLNGARPVHVSAKTGQGLDTLREAIRAFLLAQRTDTTDDLVLTSARQHEAVRCAIESFRGAATALVSGVPHEMALLDLYRGLSGLDEMTGDVVTDDILDRIFSTFCIGK